MSKYTVKRETCICLIVITVLDILYDVNLDLNNGDHNKNNELGLIFIMF